MDGREKKNKLDSRKIGVESSKKNRTQSRIVGKKKRVGVR